MAMRCASSCDSSHYSYLFIVFCKLRVLLLHCQVAALAQQIPL